MLEIVDDVAQGEIRKKLRTILGSFLFQGDDVFKKVGVLSGGEKSRLALAKMLLQPANFLVMDEPTNHLDMRSKKVLQDALAEYDGSYVIVSHDRAFLDPIVNKVIEVTTHGVRTFLGNVSDYIDKKKSERDQAAKAERAEKSAQSMKPTAVVTEKEIKHVEKQQRNQNAKKLKQAQQKLGTIEKKIEMLEARKSEIESLMGIPDFYKNGEEAKRISHEYQEVQKKLTDTYHTWNEVTKEAVAI